MCEHPLTIGIKREYNDLFTKQVMTVPCNHCEQCIHRKYNSYLVRGYFEWLNLQNILRFNNVPRYVPGSVPTDLVGNKRAFAYMDTLTYTEDSLPRFKGIPCFSSDDITFFFKRLKEFWRYRLGHPIDLSYVVVCEYGDDKVRPHYHVIFFVRDEVSFVDFIDSVWSCWHNGRTQYKTHTGRHDSTANLLSCLMKVVTSMAAVRYIFKYVLKYSDFDKVFEPIVSKMRENYDPKCDDDELTYFLHHNRPFVRASVGFGYFPEEIDIIDSSDIQVPTKNGYQQLPLPSYILRKECTEKVVVDKVREVVPVYARTPSGAFKMVDGHRVQVGETIKEKLVYLKSENGSYLYKRTDVGIMFAVQRLPQFLEWSRQRYEVILKTMPDYIQSVVLHDGHLTLDRLAIFDVVYNSTAIYSFNDIPENPFDKDSYTAFYTKCLYYDPAKVAKQGSDLCFCNYVNSCSDFPIFRQYLYLKRTLERQSFLFERFKKLSLDDYNRLTSNQYMYL